MCSTKLSNRRATERPPQEQEFRFEGDRVRLRRIDHGVILEPLIPDAAKWFDEMDRFNQEQFMGKRRNHNACIALINGNPPSVRAKFRKATDLGGQVFVSSIALFELWYGVAKSSRRDFNKK